MNFFRTDRCRGPFPAQQPLLPCRSAEKGLVQLVQSVSRSRFLTVAEVAQVMRVSTMTVYRLVKAGDLAATRIGRSYRIAEPDVDHYLASRYTQAG